MKPTSWIVTSALIITAAACGDPPTSDTRGYTKAPLERPALMVGAEEAGPMRQFGEPQRPEVRVLELQTEGDG